MHACAHSLPHMHVQAHMQAGMHTQHGPLHTHTAPLPPHVRPHTGPPPHNLFSTLQPGSTPSGSLSPPIALRVKAKAITGGCEVPCGLGPPWSGAGPLTPRGSLSASVPALPGLGCSSLHASPPQILTASISGAPPALTLTSLPSTHHLPASFTYSSPLLASLTRTYTR